MLLLLLLGASFTPAPPPEDVRGRVALHEEGAAIVLEERSAGVSVQTRAGGASVGDE